VQRLSCVRRHQPCAGMVCWSGSAQRHALYRGRCGIMRANVVVSVLKRKCGLICSIELPFGATLEAEILAVAFRGFIDTGLCARVQGRGHGHSASIPGRRRVCRVHEDDGARQPRGLGLPGRRALRGRRESDCTGQHVRRRQHLPHDVRGRGSCAIPQLWE